MSKLKLSFLVLIMLLFIPKLYAYKVWIGTSCTPKNAAHKPETWSRTAQLAEGLNINFAPCLPSPNTPSEGEQRLSADEQDWVLSYYKNAWNGMIPIPRSGVKHALRPEKPSLTDHLASKFALAKSRGYGIKSIMFYNNATAINGETEKTSFTWLESEIQDMRNWLDSTGNSQVTLIRNVRRLTENNKEWCKHPLVDDILLEAEPGKWFDNAGKRQELLRWLNETNETKNKRFIFQIPLSGIDHPFGYPSGYQQVRRFIHWLGTQLMDKEFLQNPNVILLPVTYNNPTFTFYPETENPEKYANTLTGLVLSLIEQRELFEGRNGMPTLAECDSYSRNASDGTTSVSTITKNTVNIYPNPTSSVIHIKTEDVNVQFESIELLNVAGEVMYKEKANPFANRVPVHHLPSGSYFLRLRGKETILSKKIFIRRN